MACFHPRLEMPEEVVWDGAQLPLTDQWVPIQVSEVLFLTCVLQVLEKFWTVMKCITHHKCLTVVISSTILLAIVLINSMIYLNFIVTCA